MKKSPTWNNSIKRYFDNQAYIGCMRNPALGLVPSLDLGSYHSVKNYIQYSDENKAKILSLLETGAMPRGAPKWSGYRFNRFKE
jgi:hypothetical protein